jgi:hypothetical protein
MATTTFDTLGYFEKLKAAGVPENQAKAQVEVIREIIEDKLATKQDLKELELATKKELKELELRLTTRFGAMIAAAVAILAALMALMK